MKNQASGGRFGLGVSLITGGAVAMSPADELACTLTGPFAVVCVPLAAVSSPFIGAAAIVSGLYLVATSYKNV
jgi:hypothetical protein